VFCFAARNVLSEKDRHGGLAAASDYYYAVDYYDWMCGEGVHFAYK
jgi:hypothetical protein